MACPCVPSSTRRPSTFPRLSSRSLLIRPRLQDQRKGLGPLLVLLDFLPACWPFLFLSLLLPSHRPASQPAANIQWLSSTADDHTSTDAAPVLLPLSIALIPSYRPVLETALGRLPAPDQPHRHLFFSFLFFSFSFVSSQAMRHRWTDRGIMPHDYTL